VCTPSLYDTSSATASSTCCDTFPDSHDNDLAIACGAAIGGSNRLQRGLNYMSYLRYYYNSEDVVQESPEVEQLEGGQQYAPMYAIVPDMEHDSASFYASEVMKLWAFESVTGPVIIPPPVIPQPPHRSSGAGYVVAVVLPWVLRRGLARSLGVGVGDTVALLVTTSGGGINAVEAKVAGVFISTNQAYDDAALRLPIGLAQTLLRVNGAHVWLILLEQTERTDHFLEQFRNRFSASANKLEFVPWYQQADFYNKTVALFSQQMNVLRLIIGCIIVLSISNMLVMNVLERTGEIGTLLAIGFKRKKILQQFAIEGFLLGLVGASLGLGVGYGLAELISAIGIPMPPPPGMTEGYTGEIRVTLSVVTNAFLIAFITTALAGLYPAWKASRLQIINALRHNI
jgi:hypothetical protein